MLACLALLLATLPGGAPSAAAQPAPSFLSNCENLQASIVALGWDGAELVTISVQGTARIATQDEALAYIAVCASPHPQVLCVTYELGGRQESDTVVVTGALNIVDDAHVMLDPCLASSPEPVSAE